MKKILYLYLLYASIISIIIVVFDTKQNSISYILGSLLMVFNLVALTILWNQVFNKKLIALSTSIIVIKYAILGIIIYLVFSKPIWGYEINAIWFCLGIFSLIFPVLTKVLFLKDKEKREA